MRRPQSVKGLEKLGMVQLSKSFYLRDFLYSETANYHGIQNIPDNPDLAIEVGKQLCTEILEPLKATFGAIAIRSSFRSCELNKFCNENGYNCAVNAVNYGRHIWDHVNENGHKGATVCIAIPWFTERYEQGADWKALAYWLHDHLPYSEIQFFPDLCAFNIGWHEAPVKSIYSYIKPGGYLLRDGEKAPADRASLYADFPKFISDK